MMTKEHILNEIKRTALENNGNALGIDKFYSSTGIKEGDWRGIYWARWSDAIKAAGFIPNKFSKDAYEVDWIVLKIIELIRELGKFPTKYEIKIRKRNDSDFPSDTTIAKRIGEKSEVILKLSEFCKANKGYEDIEAICSSITIDATPVRDKEEKKSNVEIGYVYLFKSGKFYKIGKSNHVGRRDYELNIQMPEKAQLVHQISTDDPTGIEIYWHNRFNTKRKNGEWFDLNKEDISAFKRRKFM